VCNFILQITLNSDTIFGSGSGVSSMVDIDIQHDIYGCPFLGARAIKGILREECANILFRLEKTGQSSQWLPSAEKLFGKPGDGLGNSTILRLGNAILPHELHHAIKNQVKNGEISSQSILEAFTTIRKQTKINYQTGTAFDKSLRNKRVVLHNLYFESKLSFLDIPDKKDLALLATCIKALHHAGMNRNRGCGELTAVLLDAKSKKMDLFKEYYKNFTNKIKKENAG